jgi:hypothetical protein
MEIYIKQPLIVPLIGEIVTTGAYRFGLNGFVFIENAAGFLHS